MGVVIPKMLEDVKSLIMQKAELIRDRDLLHVRMKKGQDYFLSLEGKQVPLSEITKGIESMTDVINSIKVLDQKIYDLETIIVVTLESLLSDSIIKARALERTNDAGDNIRSKTVMLTPFQMFPNEELVEITPQDMWFLKMVKQALAVNNIEVIKK